MDKAKIQIKELTHDLDKEVVLFFLRGAQESSLDKIHFKLTPSSIARDVTRYIDDPNKAIFVAQLGGVIIGVIMLGVACYSFTETKVSAEYYFRVDEAYRRQGIGRLLKDQALEWSKKQGAEFVIVSVGRFVGRDYCESDAAYLKMGFKDFQRDYFMEI